MFGNKTAQEPANAAKSAQNPAVRNDGNWNKIAKGTVVMGNINAEGDLRIEGKVVGTIICNSKLVVSETGQIEGDIDARNATVEGEIKGNVVTRELLQIDKTGKITGDIYTQKLVVQMGAIFTGTCKMGDAAKEVLGKNPDVRKDGQKA
jgi:cytoskeletal protein CcmA (bactofilin family)